MGGDFWVGDESVVFQYLYLRELVGLAAFFPSNDTLRSFGFFFPLARAEPLLFSS
jgi:hypothetical protein